METLLFWIQLIAHAGTAFALIAYRPGAGSRYRPFVSFISVLLAGGSLALVFGLLLKQPWAHSYAMTVLAVLVYVLVIRCHGNVANLIRGKRS